MRKVRELLMMVQLVYFLSGLGMVMAPFFTIIWTGWPITLFQAWSLTLGVIGLLSIAGWYAAYRFNIRKLLPASVGLMAILVVVSYAFTYDFISGIIALAFFASSLGIAWSCDLSYDLEWLEGLKSKDQDYRNRNEEETSGVLVVKGAVWGFVLPFLSVTLSIGAYTFSLGIGNLIFTSVMAAVVLSVVGSMALLATNEKFMKQ